MTRLLYKESLWILVIGIVGISGLMKEYMDHTIKSHGSMNDMNTVPDKKILDYSMLPAGVYSGNSSAGNPGSDSTSTTVFKSGM